MMRIVGDLNLVCHVGYLSRRDPESFMQDLWLCVCMRAFIHCTYL